jgi:hypothetical protein
MNTNTLAAAVVAKAAGIAGMRGTSPTAPDTIPASPWTIVGAHQAVMDGITTHITFPLRVYVERVTDDARTQAVVNDLVDAMVAAYWDGITIGGTVAQARIVAWNTDLWNPDIGGVAYQVPEFTLVVTILNFNPHTP